MRTHLSRAMVLGYGKAVLIGLQPKTMEITLKYAGMICNNIDAQNAQNPSSTYPSNTYCKKKSRRIVYKLYNCRIHTVDTSI
jgi:hypothetical protein